MCIRKVFVISTIAIFACVRQSQCQAVTRINGLTPQKWITIKYSVAPGRTLQCQGANYIASFEDINAKVWVPLVLTNRFKFAAGVSYRTEQIETEGSPNSEFRNVNNWNLRSAGIDLKTATRLSDRNSLIIGANLSQNATIQSIPLGSSPLNISVSATFMQKQSDNKEIGFGVLHSTNLNTLPFLPIIVWNQTFNKRNGIEISLPYKLAWRHNLSERNILHFKAEGLSRSYFIDQPTAHQFRRLDVDLGLSYTRLINKWIGFEFFGGYRKNISNELPNDIRLKTGSGFAFSSELFVIPAFKTKRSAR